VLAQLAEHVIEEWNSCVNGNLTSPIEVEFYKNA